MSELKQKVIHGVFWRSLERVGTQGVGFIVSIILARLLGPEEYGTVALLTIFLVISNVFVDSGFGIALIQKKDADDLDFNSVFYFNIVVSVLLYGVLWFGAPWVSDFYGKPVLASVLRWSALAIIINSINVIQGAVISREMKFRLSFWIALAGIIGHGVIGVTLAYRGYGLWALVFGSLGSVTLSTIVRWILIGWRPSLMFSIHRLRKLFDFGSKMALSYFIDTFYNQIYGLLIGKFYTPRDLAYFNRGDMIPSMIMNTAQNVIGSVAFPVMTQMQHDKMQLKQLARRMIKSSSFLVMPAMIGLAMLAKPLIIILLTDKWIPTVPFLQLACVSCVFLPIHVTNLQVIQASGRSDMFLKLEVLKKIMITIVILSTFRYGVLALAIGRVIMDPIGLYMNSYFCKQIVNYSFTEQIYDIMPNLLISTLMALSVYGVTYIIPWPLLLLVTQVLVGVISFFILAWVFKVDSLSYISKTVLAFKK